MARLGHLLLLLPAALLIAASPSTEGLGPNLERFDYPHPVQRFAVPGGDSSASIAYMDIRPARPNGRTVVLLHGKNFCGATWGDTADKLVAAGYRVVVPDQLGFCKSAKPAGFQYSFHGLAELDIRLLDSLGIDRFVLVGHSMGGILATRLALLHPERVEQLVLVNPLAVGDWVAEGAPYADLPALRREEEATTSESIRAYQRANYYHGNWRPEYDRWVAMLAGMYVGPGKATVVEAQARASEMIESQPVASEFPRLRMPTTFMIGMQDTTAFGRARAPAAMRSRIPAVPALARRIADGMSDARLIPFDDLGHSPQVEAPARFQAALLDLLAARS